MYERRVLFGAYNKTYMFGILIASAGTGILLVLGELLWKNKILKGEYARKFVHITTATFAAFWPFFMTRQQIAAMSLLFVLVLAVVKQLNMFKSIRSIQRTTYGELWYALGIGACALLFKDNSMYAIAVLHMALADGFAAIVGVSMANKAKKFRYRGALKTIEGSLTFLAISFFLNAAYWLVFAPNSFNVAHAAIVPVYSLISASILTVVEIVSPRGSDNVIIPLFAGTLLWLPYALFSSSYLFV